MNSFLENRPLVGRKDVVTTSVQPEPGFQPLFSPNAPLRAQAETMPAAEKETEASPRIELVQNGGKLERIIVTCTCCNRIELQCQY